MVLTDTGYWLALANPNDRHHVRALETTGRIKGELVVTWPVMTETCHLISSRLGTSYTIMFLETIEMTSSIFNITPSHLSRIRKMMGKYSQLPMDLADASLVIAAEELGQGDIVTTDRRDFNSYRWKSRKPFNNLLFPEDKVE
ncbi:MAG: PIN domain-containing protein [Gammaproteobacteria bacterium]|nr:PIN domain-containing protein [Gammaproteobacteria bacterium]